MSGAAGRASERFVLAEPRRLLVLGDVHMHLGWLAAMIQLAVQERCEAIVQLGDLGYYPRRASGLRFLGELVQLLVEAGIPLLFLDGNHDDHDARRLQKLPLAGEFVMLEPHLFYLPRGCRWTWSGVRCLAVGGAHSIDRDARLRTEQRPRTLWWPEETISESDVRRASSGGPTDILLAHDCPAGVEIPGLQVAPEAAENRERLARIVDATRPQLLVHAHYHMPLHGFYTNRLLGLDVPTVGLAHEQTGRQGYLTLDLERWPELLDPAPGNASSGSGSDGGSDGETGDRSESE